MHYRNGRAAQNGDKIVQIDFTGKINAVGVLHSMESGSAASAYCNGAIAPTQYPNTTACLCDCLHIDDLAELLKQAGLDKRPEGM